MVVKRTPIPIPKKARKSRKKQKPSIFITSHIGANILVEYHENNSSVRVIAGNYGLSQSAVYKYVKATPYTKKEKDNFYPSDVLDRIKLNPLERIKMLSNDATVNIELTMAAVRYKLEKEIERTKDNVGDKTATLDIKELILFFKEAAPYVLTKVDGVSARKDTGKTTAKGKAHDMFKAQMEVKKTS